MQELERLELKIARFLRFGVLFSGTLIFAGWLMNLKWSADPFHSFQMYGALPIKNALMIYYRNEKWGILLSYLGLASLISLPIIRVFLTAWLFFKQKDFLLGFIAVIVLIGLALSFTLGFEI